MRPYRTSHRRRGTVTVIVIAFLMLLLIMGLTFAFYGLREAEETRVYRDEHRGGHTGVGVVNRTASGIDDPPEPDTIFSAGVGSAICGRRMIRQGRSMVSARTRSPDRCTVGTRRSRRRSIRSSPIR